MNFKDFNVNGNGLKALSETKITDFKVKLKVVKLSKWMKDVASDLSAAFEAHNEKFPNTEIYNEDGTVKSVSLLQEKKNEEKEIFNIEVEDPSVKLKISEVEKLDLTPDNLSDLLVLGVLELEEDAS